VLFAPAKGGDEENRDLCRKIMVYNLQTILGNIVSHAQNDVANNRYSQNVGKAVSSTQWFDHLTFVVNVLTVYVDLLNKD
jgi:hypothetical protein